MASFVVTPEGEMRRAFPISIWAAADICAAGLVLIFLVPTVILALRSPGIAMLNPFWETMLTILAISRVLLGIIQSLLTLGGCAAAFVGEWGFFGNLVLFFVILCVAQGFISAITRAIVGATPGQIEDMAETLPFADLEGENEGE